MSPNRQARLGGKSKNVNEIFSKARARAQDAVGEYLSKEEKAEMATLGTPFTLTGLRKGSGQFGPKWTCTGVTADGDELKWSLSDNEFRSELFEELSRNLPLANMRLARNPEVSGEPYDIVPVGFEYGADEDEETLEELPL